MPAQLPTRLLHLRSGSKLCRRSANSFFRWRQDEDEDEDSTDKAARGVAAGVLQNVQQQLSDVQQKVAGVGQVRAARWTCMSGACVMPLQAPTVWWYRWVVQHTAATCLTSHIARQEVLQKTAAAAGPLLSRAKDGVAAAFSKFKPAAQSEPPNVEL